MRAGRSIEYNDAADGFTSLQRRKAVIDPVQRDAARDQFIEQQQTIQIGPRKQGKVPPRTRVAITDAADAFLLHQRTPAKRNIPIDVDFAEPDDLTTGPHRLG